MKVPVSEPVPELMVSEALKLNDSFKRIFLTGFYSNGPDGFTVTSERFGDECINIARSEESSRFIPLGYLGYGTAEGVIVALNRDDSKEPPHGSCIGKMVLVFFPKGPIRTRNFDKMTR